MTNVYSDIDLPLIDQQAYPWLFIRFQDIYYEFFKISAAKPWLAGKGSDFLYWHFWVNSWYQEQIERILDVDREK